VLRPRSAVVDNRDSRIDIDGRVNLADETLDLRVVARPRTSPLTAALAGARAGPPGRAARGPRRARAGGKAIAAIALGALTPPAALLAFVDPGESLPPVRCDGADAAPAAWRRRHRVGCLLPGSAAQPAGRPSAALLD
jgi:hypothetical protein